MKKKQFLGTALVLGSLVTPAILQTTAVVQADEFYQYQSTAQAADITNWIARTPEQIKQQIQSQNIQVDSSGAVATDGQTYVIQWGDTMWGISQATGIPIAKLAYDNNIQNVDLIYAGDTLILKKDGHVPVGYSYNGQGQHCAMTKVVINNYIHNGNNVTNIDNSTSINLTKIENNTWNDVDQSSLNLTFKPSVTVTEENNVTWKVTEKDLEAAEASGQEVSSSAVSDSSASTDEDSSKVVTTETNDSSSPEVSDSTSSDSNADSPKTSSVAPEASDAKQSSSSSTSSSSGTNAASSSTKASSSEAELEMDEFLDKIQAEIELLQAKDPSQSASPAWNFLANKDDFNQNASLVADLDMEQLYTPRAENLSVDLSKKTASTAKKAAEEIYGKLKVKASGLADASYLQLVLTKESGRDAFNVKVYTEIEESSSSSSSNSSSSSSPAMSSTIASDDDFSEVSRSSSSGTGFNRPETSTSTSSSSDSDEEWD
ncbi:LysM peptidoglycan-binding domain-containing protein [Streptococcus danieliae]|uniref:LysM peptidoglycan-binding domain-containing protein n=1 Tax=Streptococcus danieliae TaxID=747656 RepID=UPI0026E9FE4D|nr:LysM peptidoglycan-binding domain-containing protein [Streptococcus danieliae]